MLSTLTTTRRFLRALRLTAIVPALAFAAACDDDDPVEPEPEPTFTRMVLTLTPTGGGAAQSIEITRANASVSGPLAIPAAGGTLVATFLNADGSADANIATNQADYETRILTPAQPLATFTRTGPNTFTVTKNTAGALTVPVQLFHKASNHEDLQANVTFNVQ